jgi:hypothetical protein
MRLHSTVYLGLLLLLSCMGCAADAGGPISVDNPCAGRVEMKSYTGTYGMVVHGCPYNNEIVRFSADPDSINIKVGQATTFISLAGILQLNRISFDMIIPTDTTGTFPWDHNVITPPRSTMALTIFGGASTGAFEADSGVTVIKEYDLEGTISGTFSGRIKRSGEEWFLSVSGAFKVRR